ncbi:MAG: enoyl-CoA hydratase-related protein [Albidovulum sp.]
MPDQESSKLHRDEGRAAVLVKYAAADGVATLIMDNPPVNALGWRLRRDLLAALQRAEEDPSVGAIVLAGAGRGWPVGADITELGRPGRAPLLPDLCAAFAAASKPVIAAIFGTSLGGGLELALCAALRLSVRSARFGLPEISLGILPGAGGTQRLPRLIGAAPALEMMLTGAPISAETAVALGVIDKIVFTDVIEAAQEIARDHVTGARLLPIAALRNQPGLHEPGTYLDAVDNARKARHAPHDLAAPRIVDCVEAAVLLPTDEGMIFERAAFTDLANTPHSRALRHVFMAERRGAKSLPKPQGSAPALEAVAVVGGGAIGTGLATELLQQGLDVTLIEANEHALAQALARVARGQDAAQKRGEITAEKRVNDWARLKAAQDLSAVATADLVIEAVPEVLAYKTRILAQIGAEMAAEKPIFSVTDGFDPQELAAASGRSDCHISLYLCEPVRQQNLIEVASGAGLRQAPMATLHLLAKLLGWRLLRHAPAQGFMGARLRTTALDAADRCLEAGATPHEVDRACRAYGMPLGIYETRDAYGLEHGIFARPQRRRGCLASPVGQALSKWLAGQGRMGRQSGLGYHHYDTKAQETRADPAVAAELDRLRPRQSLTSGDIQRRLLAGLANEGAWAIVEGRAVNPSDIDLVAIAQGFPRWRGGPMQAADEAGLLRLRNDLRKFTTSADRFWEPAPIWEELIRNGKNFHALNGD